MAITYFIDVNDPTVKIESTDDIREIIDIMHTQAAEAGAPEEVINFLEEISAKALMLEDWD